MSDRKDRKDRKGGNVKISNSLVRAAQRLTLVEKRVVMLAVKKINPTVDNPPIEIRAKDYAKQYNIAPPNAYRELKTVCKSIMRKPPIALMMDGFDREINWAEYCDYFPNEGRVVLQFTNKMAPHISDLQAHFTNYDLLNNDTFRSLYAWRMYELLRQFKKSGSLNRKVSEFIEQMEVPESYSKDFGAIRRRIIEPALKEIKEKAGLDVTLTTEKKGRVIHLLKFTYDPEPQTTIPNLHQPAPKKPAPKPALTAEQIAKREAAMDAAAKAAGDAQMKQLLQKANV